MSRNDRSDSLSVRQDDDPRSSLKAMQEEAEQELLRAEKTRSGGVDHQSGRYSPTVPPKDADEE